MAKLLNIKKKGRGEKGSEKEKLKQLATINKKIVQRRGIGEICSFFFSLTRWPSLKCSFLKTGLGP